MTLVVCWRDNESLILAADTKISGDSAVTYTEGGPKLFLVPVIAHANRNGQIFKHNYPSFGFAYAGSSLIAQSVHAMASTCLQNLSGDEIYVSPSIFDVADLFMKCAGQYIKEMMFWRPSTVPAFEAFIFGHCPEKRDYLIHHLKISLKGDELNVGHEGHYVEQGSAFFIGSGANEFVKVHEKYRDDAIPLSVYENFELVLTGKKVPSVGGSRQFAIATSEGVELVPALIPVADEDHGCKIEILGCDVLNFGKVGNYSIGHKIFGRLKTDLP